MTNKAPRWTAIYMGVTSVAALLFSVLAYVNPAFQFGTWEAFGAAGALSLAGPLGLYVARNLATAVASAYAAINGTVAVLLVAFLLRLVEDGLDAVHAFAGGAGIAGASFAILFLVFDLAGMVALLRRK